VEAPVSILKQNAEVNQQEEILIRVGQMTRTLQDSLRGLRFDKLLERAAKHLKTAIYRLTLIRSNNDYA
jgi:chemotaxis protein CheZ